MAYIDIHMEKIVYRCCMCKPRNVIFYSWLLGLAQRYRHSQQYAPSLSCPQLTCGWREWRRWDGPLEVSDEWKMRAGWFPPFTIVDCIEFFSVLSKIKWLRACLGQLYSNFSALLHQLHHRVALLCSFWSKRFYLTTQTISSSKTQGFPEQSLKCLWMMGPHITLLSFPPFLCSLFTTINLEASPPLMITWSSLSPTSHSLSQRRQEPKARRRPLA
jgi:hypothetical protein